MSETLFPYYERELLFIRQLAQEFADKYPGAASRLLLEPYRSADPQVERLIESFALLAGRVQTKLDDDFPEITTPLLQALYPHYLAPIPSMGVLQFDVDPMRAQAPNGFALPAHSMLHTDPVSDVACRFRTAYPVRLWPVRITNAVFQAPPFPPGLAPPAQAQSALRLQFECVPPMNFMELGLERLRLYIHGDLQVAPALYEFLFNQALQVVFRPLDNEAQSAPIKLTPEVCLEAAGFAPDESLLPHPRAAHLGYRLLTELFVFPAKFWFVDLKGWDQVRKRRWRQKCEVVIFFDRASLPLERSVDAGTFRLGCTPVVNLFPHTAELVTLRPRQQDYRVVPDSTRGHGLEVYSIDSVRGANPIDKERVEVPPFFALGHVRSAPVYWHTSRTPSLAENDQGTFVDLHLVDQHFQPRVPGMPALEVRTTCSNRDLPNQVRAAGNTVRFELEAAAPLARILLLRPLTPPLRPRPRRGRLWQLVSHVSLNHLALLDGAKARASLQELLSLYDFSDPDAGQQQMAEVTRRCIEGITGVRGQRITSRIQRGLASGLGRGVEVAMEFDEEKYPGVGVFLFASVLERFLSLFVASHSFTQLAARTGQRHLKTWPPRPGEQQSL